MRLKEAKRTANIAWSDAAQERILLAAGTDAQQLDATFSTSASLEVFHVDLSSSASSALPLVASVAAPARFHKLAWTPATAQLPNGLLVGGLDAGVIALWNASTLLSGDSANSLVFQSNHHSGPVRALDVNPFQSNLLASGSLNAEVFIWDLNNPSKHLTPGPKASPPDDVTGVAWNRKVQHILASTSPSGRSIVWDLRASKPIITITESSGKVRNKAVAWHPDEATQLVTASEDDRMPVVQYWDLRNAYSPVRELQGHSRGILAVDWCPRDASMLLSSGKDNRSICWDPLSDSADAQRVTELPRAANWVFEIKWCPRDPDLIATASFDGTIAVHSLLGGGSADSATESSTARDIQEAFSLPPGSASARVAGTASPSPHSLTHAPKWFRRPVGVSFAFGGKLVTFNDKSTSVKIHKIAVDKDILGHADALADALDAGDSETLSEYCNQRIAAAAATSGSLLGGEHERVLWQYVQSTLALEPRQAYLSLLGFSQETLRQQVEELVLQTPDSPQITTDVDTSFCHADESGDMYGNSTHPQGPDAAICRAVLMGQFSAAVDLCMHANRVCDAMMLAIAGGPELVSKVQTAYFAKARSPTSRLLHAVTHRNWADVVQNSRLEQWRETVAALLTYAAPEEFAGLVDSLAQRLEQQQAPQHRFDALLCYICAGNVDRFVSGLLSFYAPAQEHGSVPPSSLGLSVLHSLMEKTLILRRAIALKRKKAPSLSSLIVSLASAYCEDLGDQGAFAPASHLLASLRAEDLGASATTVNALATRIEYASRRDPAPPNLGGPLANMRPIAPAHAFAAPAVSSPLAKPVASAVASPRVPSYTAPAVAAAPVSAPYSPAAPSAFSSHSAAPITSPLAPAASMIAPPSVASPLPPTSSLPPAPAAAQPQPYARPAQYNTGYYNPVPAPVSAIPPTATYPGVTGYAAPNPVAPANTGMTAEDFRKKAADRRWNDPPAVSSRVASSMLSAPAAITSPLAMMSGAPPVQPAANPYGGPSTASSAPPTALHTAAAAAVAPMAAAPVTAPLAAPPAPAPQEPPAPVLPPLPEEFKPFVDSLREYVSKCEQAESRPQMKKKIDEVSKKVDHLYAQLCHREIDASTVGGMSTLLQALHARDYATATAWHTYLVTNTNPDVVGQTLIALKNLITFGKQLNC